MKGEFQMSHLFLKGDIYMYSVTEVGELDKNDKDSLPDNFTW